MFGYGVGGSPVSGASATHSPSDMRTHPLTNTDAQKYSYTTKHISYEDIIKIKNTIGVREAGKNYNLIIDGHGTGLAPPGEDTLTRMLGRVVVTDVLNYHSRGAVDLSADPHFPPVGNQGQQGSCTAWATTYYANTWLQAIDNDWKDLQSNPSHKLSPAWTYNKINGGADQGSWFDDALDLMQSVGTASLANMSYNDADYYSWGNEPAWREAPKYRLERWESTSVTSTNVIKSWLDAGYCVNFAIDAYQYDTGFADGNYIISSAEYSSSTLNHAQTIVGYDDSITDDGDVGAFKVVNSWGTNWGAGGYYWITYNALKEIAAVFDYAYRAIDRVKYEPSLIGVWTFSSTGSRNAAVKLGIGPYSTPYATRTPLWDGGSYNFPAFMCLDITEFKQNWQSGVSSFFLSIGSGSSASTISSFKVEYYISTYLPGNYTQISGESPDVPKPTPGYVTVSFTYVPPTRMPIHIAGDSQFNQSNGVVAGSGTQGDPYVIQYWEIDAKGGSYAVWIENTTAHFVLRYCKLSSATSNAEAPYGTAICLMNVSNAQVEGNNISNSGCGIWLDNSTACQILNNAMYDCGLKITGEQISNWNTHNIPQSNTVNGKSVIYLKDAYAGTIPASPAQIILANCTSIALDQLYISDANYGIEMGFCRRCAITNSSIYHNHDTGIYLYKSEMIAITGNNISLNGAGVCIIESNYNLITFCIFEANANYAISIVSGTGNEIHHNNFLNNNNGMHQALAYAGENYFNTSTEGNFWSEWTAPDADGNGIVDNPYVLDGNASVIDYYPLTTRWEISLRVSAPQSTFVNTTINISIHVTSARNLSALHLYYSPPGGSSWSELNTTQSSGNTTDGFYEAVIPAQALTGILNYYITATDESSLTVNSPIYQIQVNLKNLKLKIDSAVYVLRPGNVTAVNLLVLDDTGKPLNGAYVYMRTTGGTLDRYTGATDATGNFTVNFTAPHPESDTNYTITANATYSGFAETQINVTVCVVLVYLTVNASIDCNVLSPNESSNLTVIVEDEYGQRITNATVSIQGDDALNVTTAGTTTDVNGTVSFNVTALSVDVLKHIKLNVTAGKSGYNAGTHQVEFVVYPDSLTLALRASPKPGTIRCTETSEIEIELKTRSGESVPGANITISVSRGTVTPASLDTNYEGNITVPVVYMPPDDTANNTVVEIQLLASKAGYKNCTAVTTLIVLPRPPLNVVIDIEKTTLKSRERTNVTITVTAEGRGVEGVEITVNVERGKLWDVDNTELVQPCITNSEGIVVFIYEAPEENGTIEISVEATHSDYIGASTATTLTILKSPESTLKPPDLSMDTGALGNIPIWVCVGIIIIIAEIIGIAAYEQITRRRENEMNRRNTGSYPAQYYMPQYQIPQQTQTPYNYQQSHGEQRKF